MSAPPRSETQRILNQGAGQLNLVKGWDPEPMEMLSTDLTELKWANGTRKAWLMAMVDPVGRGAMGCAVGTSANRALARQCFEQVKQRFERWDESMVGTVIHQDKDTVYTSYDRLRCLLLEAGCVMSYSQNGCKDIPWIESFWSRVKDDNESEIIMARTMDELRQVIENGFRYDNEERRHLGLDYGNPMEYYQQARILPVGLTTFQDLAGSKLGTQVR